MRGQPRRCNELDDKHASTLRVRLWQFEPIAPSMSTVRLVALGATVEVRVSGRPRRRGGRGDRAGVAPVPPRCRVRHDGREGGGAATGRRDAVVKVVHGDGGRVTDVDSGRVEGSNLPDLMQMLTQAVTRAAIDAQKGRLVMLHAAGIQDPASGATVAMVGPGGTGKTTLIRTLGPGRAYITDETVAVREDNTVLPYPKPLSVRREPSSPWKDETDPARSACSRRRDPAHLAAIVMLDRRDDHDGAPDVEHVPTLDAIAALTPETSHLPELDKPLQRMAALCDSVGGVVRVTYREAEHLAPLVDGWLGAGA